MDLNKHTTFSIVFLFIISIVMMLRQLTTPAYFTCIIEDSYTFTSWAWQFAEALKEGVVYPRWLPLNFWGYGSPTFILYPPLAFYLVAIFNMFTGSIIPAMNITKFTALFLAGTGMFFLVREFYSEKVALLAAGFYIIFPYNIFQFYFVGTFASVVSFMWFAPIILFTYRYMKNRLYKDAIYAGMCYGGLILTHLVNAYMFTFVLVAFIIYMSLAQKRPKDLFVIPFIITVGLLVSAAYLLPFLYEKQFINTDFFIGEGGGFHYYNFFILPNLTRVISPDRFWSVYSGTFIFHIILLCILILLFLLQTLKLRDIKIMESTYAVNKFFIGMAICSIFLLFGISVFIWETVPYFKYIAFPHRWLNIAAFCVVFLSASMFWSKDNFYKAKKGHNLFIVVLILVALLLSYRDILSAPDFSEKVLIPVKGSNWTLEHLPVGANIEALNKDDSKERFILTKGEGKIEILKWQSTERILEATANKKLTMKILTFDFPGWRAYIDGKETEITQEKGVIVVNIREGKHTILFKFIDTPIRYYAKLLSLVSSVSMILLVLFSKKLKRNKSGSKY
jgi:uncharacterized membrane protein